MRGTALCAAIETRNIEMTKFLLDAGCDVNARDFDGEPPLLLALRKASSFQGNVLRSGKPKQLDMVHLIINHPQCNLNKFDPVTRNTALHVATSDGQKEVVRWLVMSRSSIALNVNLKDQEGNTALHLAVIRGNIPVIELLADNKDSLCEVNTGEKTFTGYPFNLAGLSCLHVCAKTGNVDCMRALLKRLSKDDKPRSKELLIESDRKSLLSQNVNALTLFEREACLHIACRNGHTDLVRLLLDSMANVHEKDSMGNTPLLVSLVSAEQWQSMSNSIPKFLLKSGSDPNTKAKIHNTRYLVFDLEVTPLIISALQNNVELAKLLVVNGADVNNTDSMGRSALYIAISENSLSVAFYLLRECPDINVNLKLRDGSTCLHALARVIPKHPNDIKDLVKHILEHDCHLSEDNKGETPIHRACEYGSHLLLDAILEQTDRGLLALSNDAVRHLLKEAAADNLADIIQVLLSHGADMNDFDENDPDDCCLFASLQCSNYGIAKYLVEQGLDLTKRHYLKFHELNTDQGKCKADPKHMLHNERNEESDENEEATDDDDGSDSNGSSVNEFDDILNELGDMRLWLNDVVTRPKSLELSCLVVIRNYFREFRIPFREMWKLGLPDKLTTKLRYR